MPVPSSTFPVLLLTGDPDITALCRQVFKHALITAARDAGNLPKEAAKQRFDAVVVELHSGQDVASSLPSYIDPSLTLIITGSRAILKRTIQMMEFMNGSGVHALNGKAPETSLEGYLETKMGDFVKGMRNGAARNLHPMLISAVERPLIASALRETRGNQIQAAELLGLNRNTLRKKIVDLHIPLNRTRAKASRNV
jgi:DNA-binding protein Fis